MELIPQSSIAKRGLKEGIGAHVAINFMGQINHIFCDFSFGFCFSYPFFLLQVEFAWQVQVVAPDRSR